MKFTVLAALLLASSSIACGSAPAATQAGAASPVEVNVADWTPPGEQQMTLPDAPTTARREDTAATPLHPTSFSQGKKGALVTLATKRTN